MLLTALGRLDEIGHRDPVRSLEDIELSYTRHSGKSASSSAVLIIGRIAGLTVFELTLT